MSLWFDTIIFLFMSHDAFYDVVPMKLSPIWYSDHRQSIRKVCNHATNSCSLYVEWKFALLEGQRAPSVTIQFWWKITTKYANDQMILVNLYSTQLLWRRNAIENGKFWHYAYSCRITEDVSKKNQEKSVN